MGGDAGVWAEIAPLGIRRTFAPGQRIIQWGADVSRIVAIERGICKVVNGTDDGREFLVAVRGAGDIVGELAALTGQTRMASVITLSPVVVSMIERAAFDSWLDHTPGAGRRLSSMLAQRIVESAAHSADAHHRVDARLAERVLFLVDRFPPAAAAADGRVEIPLTQSDYAAWIGATRAVTTRAFGSLRRRGLVEFGRGWIRVVDRDALEALSRT